MRHNITLTSQLYNRLIAVFVIAIILITTQPVSASLMAVASSNSVMLNWTAPVMMVVMDKPPSTMYVFQHQ